MFFREYQEEMINGKFHARIPQLDTFNSHFALWQDMSENW